MQLIHLSECQYGISTLLSMVCEMNSRTGWQHAVVTRLFLFIGCDSPVPRRAKDFAVDDGRRVIPHSRLYPTVALLPLHATPGPVYLAVRMVLCSANSEFEIPISCYLSLIRNFRPVRWRRHSGAARKGLRLTTLVGCSGRVVIFRTFCQVEPKVSAVSVPFPTFVEMFASQHASSSDGYS